LSDDSITLMSELLKSGQFGENDYNRLVDEIQEKDDIYCYYCSGWALNGVFDDIEE
jgi:hypothetical protein